MLTLQQIRDKSPCGNGWTKLLKSLGNPPMDTVISLGDVAKSNGAEDAYWCVRALDWSDITLRRQVIAALLPSVERAARHTTDKRVHDCIGALKDWIDGKAADLDAAPIMTAWMAARHPRPKGLEWRRAAWAAWAVEGAARAAWRARAVEGAAWAAGAAGEAELEAQRGDLIAALPPLILKD